MSQVLVTGATGFLGGALVRRLVDDGVEVIATGRNKSVLDGLPLPDRSKIVMDLATVAQSEVSQELDGVTSVVHCAALSSAWGRYSDFWSGNVTSTENCLALAATLRVEHFIHISTPAVYFRFRDQLDITEDLMLPKPVNAYASTKGVAENRVKASGLPYTIVRPRGIYGSGDAALLPRLLRAAKAGALPRFRGGAAKTDITHVDDVVDALCAILNLPEKSVGQTLNISGGEALPISHIVEHACAANDLEVRWRDLPVRPVLAAVRLNEYVSKILPRSPEPRITAYGLGIFAYSQTLDISEADRVLSWHPKISFEEGLQRTFDGQPGHLI